MSQSSTKGIALEFGESPNLRPLRQPEEVSWVSGRCVLYAVNSERSSGGSKLLRACNSIREIFRKTEHFPTTVIFVSHHGQDSWMTGQMLAESIGRARVSDELVLLCDKELGSWSVAEKREFDHKLESAIDLLSQLAPAESGESDPPAANADSDQLKLARERRDQLLAQEKWIDAPTVHVQQGGKPHSQGINNTASRLRRGGELLGAWNGREFLHPSFQFDSDTGRLMPEMKTLLGTLPKDRSGWRQALWLFQRHGQLDGARPADVFQKDPQAVIEAARGDFEASDERW
jgi:hypothetical protein